MWGNYWGGGKVCEGITGGRRVKYTGVIFRRRVKYMGVILRRGQKHIGVTLGK